MTETAEELAQRVRQHLAHLINPNVRYRFGRTGLFSRSVVRVSTLLLAGADPNIPDDRGETPLHYAQSDLIAHLLIEYGANPSAECHLGWTPLHFARSADIVRLLVRFGADCNVPEKDGRALRPLHMAKDVGVVRALLDAGADPNGRSLNDITPLAVYPSEGKVRALLKAGADPNAKTTRGRSLLSFVDSNATPECRAAAMHALLEAGADPNARNNAGASTLLDCIDHEDAVRVLVQFGARIEADAYAAAGGPVKQFLEAAGYSPRGRPASLQRQIARSIRVQRMDASHLPPVLKRAFEEFWL